MEHSARTLLFVVNDPSFFLSHREPLAMAAQREGFRVHVATGPGAAIDRIGALGITHHLLPLSRSRTNPVVELGAIFAMYRLFRKVKPSIVHLVTIKPVTYGGIAARMARIPAVVAAVSGLGFVFMSRGVKAAIVRNTALLMYRQAFAHPQLKVIVQNADDLEMLVRAVGLRRERTVLIRGSGVDLTSFRATPEPPGAPVVLMPARLLRDKGVYEFVAAAKALKERGVDARFRIAGDLDPGNPASVPERDLEEWRRSRIVELLGHRHDMPEVLAQSSIVVLPSYREGLPKALIEAAACGRPVVTTDVPGCRDAIDANITGLLVPVRNAEALADAIQRLITQPELRRTLGAAARALAVREFAIGKIVAEHLAIYRELAGAA